MRYPLYQEKKKGEKIQRRGSRGKKKGGQVLGTTPPTIILAPKGEGGENKV